VAPNADGEPSPNPELLPRIFDYVCQEVLGQGMSGCVYRVVHSRTRREFACKEIPVKDSSAEAQQAVNEIAALGAIRHQNIVAFYTSFYEESCLYVIQEYVKGLTLADHLSVSPAVPEPFLKTIGVSILSGLAYLARSHILHRDLKPSNILIADDGRVKIADFGMAKCLKNSCEKALSYRGTVWYMSPERFHKLEYS
jgi:serine/threonine protein kinase